jgi:hypothetical protein
MFLAFLTLLVALSLSGIAAYYSIIGLTAIFAAAVIPIIVMGGILEVSKLTVTVWLHQNWHRANVVMKFYMLPAVIILMFITSMGIFGFLSKAHIEQTSANTESVVQVERITDEISRIEAGILRSEQKIAKAESSTGNSNASIQQQMDAEQTRIDQAYARIQPSIDEQNLIIENARQANSTQVDPYLTQLAGLDTEISRLDATANEYETKLSAVGANTAAIDVQVSLYQQQIDQINAEIDSLQVLSKSGSTAEIKKFQQTIGIKSDGIFGAGTAKATTDWKAAQQKRIDELTATVTQLRKDNELTLNAERDRLRALIASARGTDLQAIKQRKLDLLQRIDEVRNQESPVVTAALDQITRIRANADAQIAQSQNLINELRNSLTVGIDSDVETQISEENAKIKVANTTLDELVSQKYTLEAKTRQLEAEVGPIKYIAQLIYGEDASTNLLESAVRWVIILIVCVFDPLAIMMLLAANESISWRKKDKAAALAQEESISAKAVQVEAAPVVETVSEETAPAAAVSDEAPEAVSPDGSGDVAATRETSIVRDEIDETGSSNNEPAHHTQKIKVHVERIVFPEYDEEDPLPLALAQTIQDTTANSVATIEQLTDTVNELTEAVDQLAELAHDASIEEIVAGYDLIDDYDGIVAEEVVAKVADPEETEAEKQAKRIWKRVNPDETLKEQESLFSNNVISKLPWTDYLALSDNEIEANYTTVEFGTEFPDRAVKGDTYIRVDYLPSKVFKWNSQKWIEVDKNSSDTFAYNEAYIQHLIEKLGSGEYDPELLNDAERSQLEQQLRNQDL